MPSRAAHGTPGDTRKMTEIQSLTVSCEFTAPEVSDPKTPFWVDPQRFESFEFVAQLRAGDPDISRATAERLCNTRTIEVLEALTANESVPEDIRVVARLRNLERDNNMLEYSTTIYSWSANAADWDSQDIESLITDVIDLDAGMVRGPDGVEMTVIVTGGDGPALLFCLEPELLDRGRFVRIAGMRLSTDDILPETLTPATLWEMVQVIADEYNELWPAWCKLHDIPLDPQGR